MISVLIAAYNEEHTLPKTLASINRQLSQYPNSEVIVVVSGCSDNTLQVIRRAQTHYSNLIVVEQAEREGKASALNYGKEVARGDILILTDADVLWEDNALSYLLSHFKEMTVGLACAQVISLLRDKSLLSLTNRVHCDVWHKIRLRDSGNKCLTMPSGYLYAIRTALFPRLPTDLIDDDAYVGLCVAQKGYRLVYDPRAVVSVSFPTNISDYLKQKIRTHIGRMQLKVNNSIEISRINNKLKIESLKEVSTVTSGLRAPAVLNVVLTTVSRIFAIYKLWVVNPQVYSKWQPIRSTKM